MKYTMEGYINSAFSSSQHGLARLLGRGSNNLNNNNNNEVNQGSETQQQTSPTTTANNNQQSPANNNPTPRNSNNPFNFTPRSSSNRNSGSFTKGLFRNNSFNPFSSNSGGAVDNLDYIHIAFKTDKAPVVDPDTDLDMDSFLYDLEKDSGGRRSTTSGSAHDQDRGRNRSGGESIRSGGESNFSGGGTNRSGADTNRSGGGLLSNRSSRESNRSSNGDGARQSSVGGEPFYNIDLNDPDDLATFKYADDSNQESLQSTTSQIKSARGVDRADYNSEVRSARGVDRADYNSDRKYTNTANFARAAANALPNNPNSRVAANTLPNNPGIQSIASFPPPNRASLPPLPLSLPSSRSSMRASKRYAPINPLSPASIPEETEMAITTPQPPFRRFQDQRLSLRLAQSEDLSSRKDISTSRNPPGTPAARQAERERQKPSLFNLFGLIDTEKVSSYFAVFQPRYIQDEEGNNHRKAFISDSDLPCVIGFTSLVFLVISLSSPYWLVSYTATHSPFIRMGPWEACFNRFRYPRLQYDKPFHGCHPLWGYDYRPVREWLIPPWLLGVQALLVLALILALLARALSVVVVIRQPVPILLRFGYQIQITLLILDSLTGLLLIITSLLFAFNCWRRDWLLYPNWNYLSWGWGTLLVSFSLQVVTVYFTCREARREKLKQQFNLQLLEQLEPRQLETPIGSGIYV